MSDSVMSKSVGLILRLIAPVVVVDRLIAADQIHSALVACGFE